MKAKDKKRKVFKITIKRIIILFSTLLILLYGIIFYNHYFMKVEVYSKELNSSVNNNEQFKISDANNIDLDEVILENSGTERKDEYTVEETELEYITKYRSNNSLPKGIIQVIQEGREGKQEITKKKVYENGEMIKEEYVSSKVTKSAVDKIVEIGSSKHKSSYEIKVGEKVYISSDRASIMAEPTDESQKLATFNKDTELKILEINGDWYKIFGQGVTGFVKKENTGYNYKFDDESAKDNKKTINKNIDNSIVLNKPSGLSLEQFKSVLTDGKDANKIFENNAEYFYYIEKQYNINGIFVASVGIHESAWGTSKIAQNKKNLFGYGAYDSNPYNGAYSFSDYSECIDLIARVFVKYYINPAGTAIYGNEKAAGTYYNGANLEGINKRYATDPNWSSKVYQTMKYLYNKL